jgi:hypothetical protein
MKNGNAEITYKSKNCTKHGHKLLYIEELCAMMLFP